MTEIPSQPSRSGMAGPRAVTVRWAGLVLLLFAETALLRILLSVRSIDAVGGWWSGLLGGPSAAARVAIAFVAALLVISGPRLVELWRQLRERAALDGRWWLWLTAHVAAYGALLGLAKLTEGASGPATAAVGMTLATTALVCWVAAVAPLRCWLHLLRQERVAVLAGVGLSAVAWYAGRLTVAGPATVLSGWTLVIVHRLLGLMYDEVQFRPEDMTIVTRGFEVQVGPLCSGLEGIGLICVFLAAFLWVFRKRLRYPQAWLLFPLGITVIWLCNSLRVTALIMVGIHLSQGVALRGFHSQAGWIFFNVVALGLMAGALRSRFFVKDLPVKVETVPVHQQSSAPGYVLPLLALLAASMLTTAFSDGGPGEQARDQASSVHVQPEGAEFPPSGNPSGEVSAPSAAESPGAGTFDRLYPLKVLATGLVLLTFRSTWWNAAWSWSWSAVANGAAIFVLWIVTADRTPPEDTAVYQGVSQLASGWAALWVVFRVLGSSVTVPLAEELAYRGYLWRRLASREFESIPYEQAPWWAAVLSSIAFGLMHGRWVAGTAAGLAFAWEARRRGRIGDAVLAHATANALIAADVLLAGAWWLW